MPFRSVASWSQYLRDAYRMVAVVNTDQVDHAGLHDRQREHGVGREGRARFGRGGTALGLQGVSAALAKPLARDELLLAVRQALP